MSGGTVWALALGMSMDAFAASLAQGARAQRPHWRRIAATALLFGAVEAAMPVLGWLAGRAAHHIIADWDHWVAFGLLWFLGIRMMCGGLRPDREQETAAMPANGIWPMLLTAVGTGIDSMVAGVGLAFLQADIAAAALAIGTVTALMCACGMVLGHYCGRKAGKRAEIFGGLMLMGIGAAILSQHLHGLA